MPARRPQSLPFHVLCHVGVVTLRPGVFHGRPRAHGGRERQLFLPCRFQRAVADVWVTACVLNSSHRLKGEAACTMTMCGYRCRGLVRLGGLGGLFIAAHAPPPAIVL
ncbi:hypothetical protein TraAM80_01199, partial [Trypanosoma rangeli]